MHDVITPHCSYCEHFCFCLRTDVVTDWGYCAVKVGADPPPQEELEVIKREVAAENFLMLLERAADLGLFVPTFTDCKHYYDGYPI